MRWDGGCEGGGEDGVGAQHGALCANRLLKGRLYGSWLDFVPHTRPRASTLQLVHVHLPSCCSWLRW